MHVLIPGSFNPFHAGHAAIGLYCKSKDLIPVYEVSTINCDVNKPPISYLEVERRIGEIEKYGFLAVPSDKPYFTQKVRKEYYINGELLDISTICIGADTWNRFVDPSKYFGNVALRNFALVQTMKQVDFLIMPRPNYKIVEVPDVQAFYTVATDFTEINVSSTEIRRAFNGES
jgi:nicotinic acid mononucleotide adenylyltransferase